MDATKALEYIHDKKDERYVAVIVEHEEAVVTYYSNLINTANETGVSIYFYGSSIGICIQMVDTIISQTGKDRVRVSEREFLVHVNQLVTVTLVVGSVDYLYCKGDTPTHMVVVDVVNVNEELWYGFIMPMITIGDRPIVILMNEKEDRSEHVSVFLEELPSHDDSRVILAGAVGENSV